MQGGCPAGTGATATPGLRGPVAEAWKIGVSGDIESEPRVWENTVLIPVRRTASERALHVVHLADGRAKAQPLVCATKEPLEPCIWGSTILLRDTPKTLTVYRARTGVVRRTQRETAKDEFHSPTLVGNWIYALDGGDLVGIEIGGTGRWRTSGTYRGRIAVRRGFLFAFVADKIGNLNVAVLDRVTGGEVQRVFCGAYKKQGYAPPGNIASICVNDMAVFARHYWPLGTADGGDSLATRTDWSEISAGYASLRAGGLPFHIRLPVGIGPRWLVLENDPKRGTVLRLSEPDTKDRSRSLGWILADSRRHAKLTRGKTPYAVAGKVVFVGGSAFDSESRHLLWSGLPEPLKRPVPARGSLLLVTAARELTAFRRKGDLVSQPLFLGAAGAVGSKDAAEPQAVVGLVVFSNDRAHKGAYTIAADGSQITVSATKRKKVTQTPYPIAKVDVLLDAEDRVLYARSARTIRPALAQYHFRRQAKDYEKLARDAYKSYDAALMARLIAAADRGITEKKLAFPRKQQKALIDRPRKAKQKVRAKLLAREKELTEEVAAHLARALASPIDDPRWPVQRGFVRAALARNPRHTRATELVRERLPAWLPAPTPFHGLDWLDLVDEFAQLEVKRIEAPKAEHKNLTREQRVLGAALTTWRKDLVAIQGDELLILTPLARPGRIAACLSMGTLACDALAEVFKSGTAVRKDPWPLILQLFETRKEYLEFMKRLGKSSKMESTAGHYDPEAGVSRIYLPAGKEGWDSVMATYAHEITHHWIRERCPLFKSSESRHLAGMPGNWIVEGMATFVEEFAWDVGKRTWDTNNPRAGSLDTVASAKPKQLHPWKNIFNFSSIEFWLLDRKNRRHEIPMQWRLGYFHKISDSGMYYAQSAAACHYLYHAGEQERRQLLAYVRDYYTAKIPRRGDSINNHFGLSPEALGQRVLEYAKRVSKPR